MLINFFICRRNYSNDLELRKRIFVTFFLIELVPQFGTGESDEIEMKVEIWKENNSAMGVEIRKV